MNRWFPSRYAKFVCYSQGIAENRLFSVSPVFYQVRESFRINPAKNLLSDDGQALHSFKTALSPYARMSLIYHWEIQPDAEAELKTITNENFNPAKNILLETTPGISPISW